MKNGHRHVKTAVMKASFVLKGCKRQFRNVLHVNLKTEQVEGLIKTPNHRTLLVTKLESPFSTFTSVEVSRKQFDFLYDLHSLMYRIERFEKAKLTLFIRSNLRTFWTTLASLAMNF